MVPGAGELKPCPVPIMLSGGRIGGSELREPRWASKAFKPKIRDCGGPVAGEGEDTEDSEAAAAAMEVAGVEVGEDPREGGALLPNFEARIEIEEDCESSWSPSF